MPAFEYQACDAQGRNRHGVLEGDTARQVRQQLREQGLTPLVIEAIRQTTDPTPNVRRETARKGRQRTRLSAAELSLLTRQLATLVRAGLAVEEALRACAQQAEKSRSKSLLLAVRSRVLEGHSLADGFNDFPYAFPEIYRATVAAGEQSGHLDLVLDRLADYTETRQHIRSKTLMALFYPLILTGVAVLVVIALLTYVVPQVVQVFANMQQQLPWLTRALIAVSDFLHDWGLGLVLLLGAAGFGLRLLLRLEWALTDAHRLLLRLPVLGRLLRGLNAARFTRTLSILTASGVPVLEALRIAAQVVANRPMRTAVINATHRVREGSSLHSALEHSGLFPPITLSLIASGESSGDLEGMLERAAVNQEREIETLTSIILGLFEPLLILTMGGVVLTIVLAILMPIFELNQLVQ